MQAVNIVFSLLDIELDYDFIEEKIFEATKKIFNDKFKYRYMMEPTHQLRCYSKHPELLFPLQPLPLNNLCWYDSLLIQLPLELVLLPPIQLV